MKKLTKKSIMVAFVILATVLVGCKPELKEQSSVSIDDFKKEATIVGTLSYDRGQDFDGTKYTRLIEPVANVTVVAVLQNEDFAPNSNASGNFTCKATTNEKGEFEIKVPVSEKGVTVRVKTNDFVGQYRSVISVKDGKPVYDEEEVVYTLAEKTFFLEPDDVKVADGIFTREDRELPEEYKYFSEYQVVVGQAKYTTGKDANDEETVSKQYVEAKNVDVVINVTYKNETFKYVSSTDSDGVSTFNIPTTESNWTPVIEVKVNPYMEEKFTYYRKEKENDTTTVIKKYTLSGYFEQAEKIIDTVSFNEEGIPTPYCRVKMNFVALGDDTEAKAQNNEDWSDEKIKFEF